MSSRTVHLVLVVASLILAHPGRAADRPVLGQSLLVGDPTGVVPARRVKIAARDRLRGTPPPSDPRGGGAALTVVANGATPSLESFALDASGWARVPGGFRYRGPTGADGDPVRRVMLVRTAGGRFSLRVELAGRIGSQPLAIVPPAPGTDAGLVLDVPGGDRYCVAFGGAAGGTMPRNDARTWRVVHPTDTAACPAPPTTTSTTTTATTLAPI